MDWQETEQKSDLKNLLHWQETDLKSGLKNLMHWHETELKNGFKTFSTVYKVYKKLVIC